MEIKWGDLFLGKPLFKNIIVFLKIAHDQWGGKVFTKQMQSNFNTLKYYINLKFYE